MDFFSYKAETRDPAILDEPGAIHQSPSIQPLTIIEPIILHPVLQDPKAMEIVASQQNLQGTSTKRRTRTPFTVIEVTALVQAVELLGTGRYTIHILIFRTSAFIYSLYILLFYQ